MHDQLKKIAKLLVCTAHLFLKMIISLEGHAQIHTSQTSRVIIISFFPPILQRYLTSSTLPRSQAAK
jgi:hypothetical protein